VTQTTPEPRPLALAGCSFGWLHLAPLPSAPHALARHALARRGRNCCAPCEPGMGYRYLP
jgi:hypothetical protein